MSPDNMVDAKNLGHLILDKDKVPGNEEVFAPDPDTKPYLTKEVLAEEEATYVYVSTPESEESAKNELNITEIKHQSKYRLVLEKIKELTNTEVIAGKGNDEIYWKVTISCGLDKLGSRQKKMVT